MVNSVKFNLSSFMHICNSMSQNAAKTYWHAIVFSHRVLFNQLVTCIQIQCNKSLIGNNHVTTTRQTLKKSLSLTNFINFKTTRTSICYLGFCHFSTLHLCRLLQYGQIWHTVCNRWVCLHHPYSSLKLIH